MFEANSRYNNVEDDFLKAKDGKIIAFKKRRFLPDGSKMTVIQEIMVAEGDRLDQIANMITGDPEQFWRICDSNNTMHPLELTSNPGSIIKITRPWG